MGENGFWKEKFFYILIILILASYAWTTACSWDINMKIESNKNDLHEKYSDIITRLTRIETKLSNLQNPK